MPLCYFILTLYATQHSVLKISKTLAVKVLLLFHQFFSKTKTPDTYKRQSLLVYVLVGSLQSGMHLKVQAS